MMTTIADEIEGETKMTIAPAATRQGRRLRARPEPEAMRMMTVTAAGEDETTTMTTAGAGVGTSGRSERTTMIGHAIGGLRNVRRKGNSIGPAWPAC